MRNRVIIYDSVNVQVTTATDGVDACIMHICETEK